MVTAGERPKPFGAARLDGIQILRGIAALLVVSFHTLLWAPGAPGGAPDPVTAFGTVGVDIFFVISGFIMFYVSFPAGRPPLDPARFLLQRLTRIYPLYWFGLGLTLVLWRLGLMPAVTPTAPALLRSILLVPSDLYIVGVAWTLVYEMAFYLVFAATLWRGNPAFSLGATGATLLGLFVAGHYVSDPGLRSFLCYPITAEFFFGLALGYFAREKPSFVAALRPFWPVGLLILIVAPMVAPNATTHFPPHSARLLWGAGAFFIVASFLSVASGQGRSHRLLILLGDASYAIYLLHPALLSCYQAWMRGTHPGISEWLAAPAMVGICVAAGLAVHFTIERALIDGTRRLFQGQLLIARRTSSP